jgi:hypothetical protein
MLPASTTTASAATIATFFLRHISFSPPFLFTEKRSS